MKIFIDFDDVIFNTKQLRSDLIRLFSEYEISEETFKKNYYDENRSYDPAMQIKKIQAEIGRDLGGLEDDMEKLLKNLERYVFNDFQHFSKTIGKKNISILSFGSLDFQAIKIENSKVRSYTNRVEITNGLKSEAIKRIFSENGGLVNENTYFIDDRIKFIEEVKREIPQIKTILVKRPEGRYNDECNECCDFEVKNLIQAQEIIFQIEKNGK